MQLIEESRKYNGRKMKYSTRQQKIILECLQEYGDTFYTIDQFMELLWKRSRSEGQRYTEDWSGCRRRERRAEGSVCGGSACPVSFYTCDEERKNYGKLVCLECGHTIPLQCGCIDHFVGHVLDEHGFEIDQSRTIFYGYCDSCRRLKK